jgi:hypothetical protein
MTSPAKSGIWRDMANKCKYCLRLGVPMISIELLVYEKDERQILTQRIWKGCKECLLEMDNYVKWTVRESGKRVGVYCPSKKSLSITEV